MKTLKRSITVLVCLILFASCSVTKYKQFDSKIGLVQTNYWSGQLKSEAYAKIDSINGWIFNGLAKGYYKNGQLEYKGNFIDGKPDGLAEYYYDNGQLKSKGNFIDGKPDGLAKSYYKNGQLKNKENFINGELDGIFIYLKNGQVEYKGDIKLGICEFYYENGQLNERHHHKENETYDVDKNKDGISVTYFKNGKLKRKGNYVDNKKDGVWKLYKKNGKLKNKATFKDGKEID